MKNKKGFTLVELLAVIAILAILVIIALPNVINMYTKARKNAFLTEAQNVLKSTSNKFIQESVNGKNLNVVSNTKNSLDLSGEKINYNVKLDSQGKILSYVISNDNFCISSSKDIDKLSIEDISDKCLEEEVKIAGTLVKNFYQKSGRTSKDLVSSITFYDDGRKIDASEKYDVSEAQDNSIIMYVSFSKENSSLLDLTIVADGKIMLPEDSSNLFDFASINSCAPSVFNLSKLEFNSAIDTSKVKNMRNMFRGLAASTLDLSDFNTANVTDMNNMFFRSQVLSLDLSSFDTSNVTNMNSMFYLSDATVINLSSFDTRNVIDMSYMFMYSSANTLNLNNFNTINVTNINSMFRESAAITIDLSSFNTTNVTDMSYVFMNAAVSSLDLSSFNTSKVTKMYNMFSGCKAIKINVSNFDISNVTDMRNMFEKSQVPTLDLSSFEPNNIAVDNMSFMFNNASTTTVYVKNSTVANKINSIRGIPTTLNVIVK